MRIVIVPGSNRAGARSLVVARLAEQACRTAGCETDLLSLELGPEFLAPTAYRMPTPGITALVGRFLAADGVIFVVPEYNGSYPGVLKLFIDQLPYPQGFDRRPCAFIGLASGTSGALRAVEHLQAVAGYRNAYQYPQRLFLAGVEKLLTADGALMDAKLAERLNGLCSGFAGFVRKLSAP
jgi:chromate reductase, NAD(P)H dehydrogenase (quinone)